MANLFYLNKRARDTVFTSTWGQSRSCRVLVHWFGFLSIIKIIVTHRTDDFNGYSDSISVTLCADKDRQTNVYIIERPWLAFWTGVSRKPSPHRCHDFSDEMGFFVIVTPEVFLSLSFTSSGNRIHLKSLEFLFRWRRTGRPTLTWLLLSFAYYLDTIFETKRGSAYINEKHTKSHNIRCNLTLTLLDSTVLRDVTLTLAVLFCITS